MTKNIKQEIIKILKKNKYENDFAGNYPYDPEEYADMIFNFLVKEYDIKRLKRRS